MTFTQAVGAGIGKDTIGNVILTAGNTASGGSALFNTGNTVVSPGNITVLSRGNANAATVAGSIDLAATRTVATSDGVSGSDLLLNAAISKFLGEVSVPQAPVNASRIVSKLRAPVQVLTTSWPVHGAT